MKKTAALIGLIAVAALATACSGTPSVDDRGLTVTTAPSEAATAGQQSGATAQETPGALIPYGGNYTFNDADGPAWTVTINKPADITQRTLDEARELYGDDDEDIALLQPDKGMFYLGVTGTVERVLDSPGDPGLALDVTVVTSDGEVFTEYASVIQDKPPLTEVGVMYAAAQSDFMKVLAVPAGITAQVAVTMQSTGESIYFGE